MVKRKEGSVSTLSEMVMLRCPTCSVDRYPARPADVEPVDDIRRMWTDPVLRESVRVASSVLYDGIVRLLVSPDDLNRKKVESLRRALVRYAVRISTRTTPFGTFSGFAMVGVRDGDPVQLGAAHRKHARVGSEFARKLACDVDPLRDEILVQLNPTAVMRSDRLTSFVRPRGNDGSVNESSSVRATQPVLAVLRIAQTPVRVDALLQKLAAEFPDVDATVLRDFLRELSDAGLIVSELDGSVFDRDPLTRLRSEPMVATRIENITKALDRYARSAVGQGEDEIRNLYRMLRADSNKTQEELQVDLQLDVSGYVPSNVVRWAEKALHALIRTTPVAAWQPEIQAHAERFADHFGETLVPLDEVLDPVRGVGFPAGYPTSQHQLAGARMDVPEQVQRAGRRLRANLIEQARQGGRTRVALTEELVRTMPIAPGRQAASYDVFLHLQNPSAEAPAQAVLGAVGVGMPAGRAHGRFAHHDPRCHEQMARAEAHQRTVSGSGVQFFEIDYVSNRAAVNNVSRVPSMLPLRMALTTGDFDTIAEPLRLQDVLVGVGSEGFYLVHSVTGQRLSIYAGNLVAPDVSTDLVRFLEEVATDGVIRPMWHWGDLHEVLDFLPGVTFDEVELVAPQWRLPTLIGDPLEQDRALQRWISEKRVPDHIYVGNLDNRLLLDLRDRVHRDLLRREQASGVYWLSEAPDPARISWVRDAFGRSYVGEVVVSVAADEAVEQPPPPERAHWSVDLHRARVLPPGREWWYACLYGSRESQNSVLARLVHRLPNGSWFHVRYHDTVGHHLRIRLRSDFLNEADATMLFTELFDQQRVSHYSINTYRREIERYGGLNGIRAAESLFCFESGFLASRSELLLTPAGGQEKFDELSAAHRDAAELIKAYLHVICDNSVEVAEVLEYACAGYREEFRNVDTVLRRSTRSAVRMNVSAGGSRATDALAGQLAEPGRGVAKMLAEIPGVGYRVRIRQSLVHMFANRLGLDRRDEYRVLFLLDSILRANQYRVTTDV